MVGGRQIALDIVRERISPGRRRDRPGQPASIPDRRTRPWPSKGENRIFFTCVVSSDITDERPTSLPVPAVVGSAKMWKGLIIGRTCGWSQSVFKHRPLVHRHQRDGLGHIERGTAAETDDGIGAMCARCSSAAIACEAVGLPQTPENTATSSPPRCDWNSPSIGKAATPLSVTTSGRDTPTDFKCSATSLRAPGPKWMVVGRRIWKWSSWNTLEYCHSGARGIQ